MPRVTKAPRGHFGTSGSNQNQSPLKIPLNDDRHEKAIRFQSRQALHDIQINQIKAAASPIRKASNSERVFHETPKTPRSNTHADKENIDDDGMLAMLPGTSTTPMKRMPILANFEEWMKMATDNKINATNSWNFALIDYFHDMSLLKEGDGVNFQKASCTLDGCVKIYTSRVDSVATETGKLLSGLADSAAKKSKRADDEDDEVEEDEEEHDDGTRKKSRRKVQRSSEATLVSDYTQLQLRKFELEFTVDPLFKKASADFDEGGAKGLLLNHLAIDSRGRITFDSSDEREYVDAAGCDNSSRAEKVLKEASPSPPVIDTVDEHGSSHGSTVDISALGRRYFPDVTLLDFQDICPTLKSFDLGNPASLELPFLRENKDVDVNTDREAVTILGPSGSTDDGHQDDVSVEGLNDHFEADFGDGGEAWVRDMALEPAQNVHRLTDATAAEDNVLIGVLDNDSNTYGASLDYERPIGEQDSILSYFDKASARNWAGPEHWRIRRVKDNTKAETRSSNKRKERDPFEMDFLLPIENITTETINTVAPSATNILLPRTQWKSKARNLLPDDKHFSSRQLMRLFLKPRARLGRSSRRKGMPPAKAEISSECEADEAYWARQDATALEIHSPRSNIHANYDANFFQDDGLAFAGGLPDDDDEFTDAREAFSPEAGVLSLPSSQRPGIDLDDQGKGPGGAFGSQLVTQSMRLRPEYVQYAKVAKKVDVRRLKEEMWKGMDLEAVNNMGGATIRTQQPEITGYNPVSDQLGSMAQESPILHFTQIINGLQQVYPKQAMTDISTSYCFICLLHLANEKGLKLENDGGLEELSIYKDPTKF